MSYTASFHASLQGSSVRQLEQTCSIYQVLLVQSESTHLQDWCSVFTSPRLDVRAAQGLMLLQSFLSLATLQW